MLKLTIRTTRPEKDLAYPNALPPGVERLGEAPVVDPDSGD
jgi:hypothetical protein